jgi:uncharacterized protein YjbI with pentapeptide repeats
MANPEHLKIFKQGVPTWNKWRDENLKTLADLRDAALGGSHFILGDLRRVALRGADLREADLRRANLSEADLTNVAMSGANLGEASLTEAYAYCADFVGADLRGADLRSAYFNRAIFAGANLSAADLTETDLTEAILFAADLTQASLRLANLRGSDFATARLVQADLHGAVLNRALFDNSDFTDARVGYTVFADNDLSKVTGLDTVLHLGPSTIGVDTIYKSRGNIPEVFLRGCGVPEDVIVYMRSLVRMPTDYYRCFISYSSKDDPFAQRLFDDLQSKNVRCWKFDENAKWGEPVWGEIDTAIRQYDKLVVICSKDSLQSGAVIREIERALQKEDREHKNVLFPVRIDDYLFEKWDHPRKADVVRVVAGDFRGSDNLATYAKAFPRFLEALNRPQQASETG